MNNILSFFRLVYKYRYTIWVMALQELRVKYVGSVLGGIWNIIHPIVLVFIYWIVFSVGFKVPPPSNIPFLTWFFCAFVAWQCFSDSLLSSSISLQKNKNLIKKTVFPSELLPLIAIIANFINSSILVLLLVVLMIFQGVEFSFFAFQAIYYFFAILVLTLGAGWFFSAASVLLKDIKQILTIILQLLFWATPIFYYLEMFPSKYRVYWKLNPIYYLTEGFRKSFLYETPFWSDGWLTLYYWLFTFITVVVGYLVFKKVKMELADHL